MIGYQVTHTFVIALYQPFFQQAFQFAYLVITPSSYVRKSDYTFCT